MTTEPHISGASVLSALKGSLSSMVIFFVLLSLAVCFSVEPGDDGPLKGGISLFMTMPFVWLITFLYFLFLGLINCRTLKCSLLVSNTVCIILSSLFGLLVYNEAGFKAALISFSYCCFGLSLFFSTGAWAWSKPSKST